MNKICIKCDLPKDILDYALKSKGKRSNTCKVCHNLYSKNHYQENKKAHIARAHKNQKNLIKRNREYIHNQKDKPCKDCKHKYPPYVMEFDHINHDKEYTVSCMINTSSIQKIQKEIDKCELVCANCHRIRTFKRKGLLD